MKLETWACYLTNQQTVKQRNDTWGTTGNPRVRVRWSAWIGHGDPKWALEMLVKAIGIPARH